MPFKIEINSLSDRMKPTGSIDALRGIEIDAVGQSRRRLDVLASIEDLPSLPTIVTEVLALANDENSVCRDFEAPFRKDQAMTAKLIKLVNSSFYSREHEITSISRAIVVLGFKTLKSMVLATSASEMLNRQMDVYGYDEAGLWEHSLLCAVLSREIGETFFSVNKDVAEELFIAGLLHDIGKIVIAPYLEKHRGECDNYLQKMGEGKTDITMLERHVLGIDHVEAGVAIAQSWNLGDRLSSTIGAHHNDEQVVEGFSHEAVVMLADLLSVRQGMGLVAQYSWMRSTPPNLLTGLSIKANDIQTLKSSVKDAINSAKELLQKIS